MKKLVIIASIGLLVVLGFTLVNKTFALKAEPFKKLFSEESTKTDLRFGDIVFQSSKSGQSYAIQLATKSKYSHVGMLFQKDGEWMVLEAVQPVKLTPLSVWKSYGDGGVIEVKRIKNAEKLITDDVADRMKTIGNDYLGKNYDIYFDWSDEEIYCSELVWKIYNQALGVEIGELRPLRDFDLSDPIVKQIMNRRYGSEVPLDSKMISPGDMFNCTLLDVVNY